MADRPPREETGTRRSRSATRQTRAASQTRRAEAAGGLARAARDRGRRGRSGPAAAPDAGGLARSRNRRSEAGGRYRGREVGRRGRNAGYRPSPGGYRSGGIRHPAAGSGGAGGVAPVARPGRRRPDTRSSDGPPDRHDRFPADPASTDARRRASVREDEVATVHRGDRRPVRRVGRRVSAGDRALRDWLRAGSSGRPPSREFQSRTRFPRRVFPAVRWRRGRRGRGPRPTAVTAARRLRGVSGGSRDGRPGSDGPRRPPGPRRPFSSGDARPRGETSVGLVRIAAARQWVARPGRDRRPSPVRGRGRRHRSRRPTCSALTRSSSRVDARSRRRSQPVGPHTGSSSFRSAAAPSNSSSSMPPGSGSRSWRSRADR